MRHLPRLIGAVALICAAGALSRALADEKKKDEKPSPIATVKVDLGRPASFTKDVLPVLENKCLDCHNLGLAENKLVLETPGAMVKGGKRGPSIVAGKSGES